MASEDSLNALEQSVDPEGFIEWLERYNSDRWSRVTHRGDAVTVWSGKYPAFSRFQQDLRPHLHEHGLVISRTNHDVPMTIDGEGEKVHWVKAVPITKAVAATQGRICERGNCTTVTDEPESYCDECAPLMKKIHEAEA